MTKIHPTKTEIAAMNGKRKRRRSSSAAASTSNSRDRRATEKPANGELDETPPCSQPNHVQSAPTNAAQAMTEANAKMPAATQRRCRLNACAIP